MVKHCQEQFGFKLPSLASPTMGVTTGESGGPDLPKI